MSFPIDLSIDERQLERIRLSLADQPGIMDAALARALNRTASFIMRNIARDASAASDIPARLVRKRMFQKRATRNQLESMIWLGVLPFRASQLMGRPLTQDDIKRYRGKRISVRGMNLPSNAFVQRIYGSAVDIYARTGRSRFPVRVQTKDVAMQWGSIAQDVADKAQQVFFSTLDHEIAFRTGQLG
jgi:hypothetical protein